MSARRRLAALVFGIGALAIGALAAAASASLADERYFTLASTTSPENAGLLAHLLPPFMEQTGIQIRVVAVGTGQAVRLARNGDADVLLVHHRPSEEALVAEGYALERQDVMYNDFVIVGPREDPAEVAHALTAAEAFRRIGLARALFVSRGDDSGTHKKELALWSIARIDADAASGDWYREAGSGMGATLNTAAALGGYLLTDRATWMAFRNKAGLGLLFEGDPALFNQYAVVLMDPARFPHVRVTEGRTFVVWLTSKDGQQAIADFKIDGRQLFFPNATPPGS